MGKSADIVVGTGVVRGSEQLYCTDKRAYRPITDRPLDVFCDSGRLYTSPGAVYERAKRARARTLKKAV